MRRRAREDGAWIRVAFIKKYAGTVLGAALLLALAVFGITYRNEIWAVLTQQDARDAFIAFVHDSGFLGLLAFLGLQVLQVVVAVLPGEPVELMAGLLYGTWGGLALCLLGVGLSSAAVYYCVRAAGARAIDASVLAKYHFLRDEAHVKFHPGHAQGRAHLSGAVPARQAPCVFSHLHTGAHPVGDHQYLCGQPVRRGKLGREPGGVPCHRGCGGAVRDFSGPHSGRHCRAEGEIQSGKARGFVIYCLWISQQRAGD